MGEERYEAFGAADKCANLIRQNKYVQNLAEIKRAKHPPRRFNFGYEIRIIYQLSYLSSGTEFPTGADGAGAGFNEGCAGV
jgi:hypothetical protein